MNYVLAKCCEWKRFLGLRPKIGFSGKSCGSLRGMATKMDSVQQNPESISYLNQQQAAEIDEMLMGPLGFSVDQLMVSLLISPFSFFILFDNCNIFWLSFGDVF